MAFCDLIPEARRSIVRQVSGIENEMEDVCREIELREAEIEVLYEKLEDLKSEKQPDIDWMRNEQQRMFEYEKAHCHKTL